MCSRRRRGCGRRHECWCGHRHSRGHRRGRGNRRGRGRMRGFSFNVFLTKMLFDVLSNAFICQIPQNGFKAIFTRNNHSILQTSQKRKNTI